MRHVHYPVVSKGLQRCALEPVTAAGDIARWQPNLFIRSVPRFFYVELQVLHVLHAGSNHSQRALDTTNTLVSATTWPKMCVLPRSRSQTIAAHPMGESATEIQTDLTHVAGSDHHPALVTQYTLVERGIESICQFFPAIEVRHATLRQPYIVKPTGICWQLAFPDLKFLRHAGYPLLWQAEDWLRELQFA